MPTLPISNSRLKGVEVPSQEGVGLTPQPMLSLSATMTRKEGGHAGALKAQQLSMRVLGANCPGGAFWLHIPEPCDLEQVTHLPMPQVPHPDTTRTLTAPPTSL